MKRFNLTITICMVILLGMTQMHAQTLYFKVEGAKSYVKVLRQLKPPLQVSLNEGGYLIFTIDPQKHTLKGEGHDLSFTTDQFDKSANYNITGKMQKICLKLSKLELIYNANTGEITSCTGFTSYYGDLPLFPGSMALWYQGPSKLVDGNSSTIDMTNGLGVCNGKLILEVGKGNPTDFYINIEATLMKEDLDGDGTYENECKIHLWKELKLLYDPPKIRIIFPGPLHNVPLDIDMCSLHMSELVAMAIEQSGPERREEPVSVLVFENAGEIPVVLIGPNGRVIAGDFSGTPVKEIGFRSEEGMESRILILPGLGIGEKR